MLVSKLRQSNLRYLSSISKRNFSQVLKAFATVDPDNLGKHSKGFNLVNGEWKTASAEKEIIDPMNGKILCT